MYRRVMYAIIGIAFLGSLMPVHLASADPWAEALGGAAEGAIFGAIVGGGDGAATGAILGGAMGAASGGARQQERRRQQEVQRLRAQERARWEQQRQMQQQQMQQQRQQAWAQSQPVAASSDATLIIETQKSLVRLGYKPVSIDGQLGAQTINAIKAYQSDKGLLSTGQPSQELLQHMVQNGG